MNILSRITGFARSPGDPKIISVGPSVRPVADETARPSAGSAWRSVSPNSWRRTA